MAILWAPCWIEEVREKVFICSDSAAALETIRAGKSKVCRDIVNYILSYHFCWVPGHAGVLGNKQADYIAKESLVREIDIYASLGRVERREMRRYEEQRRKMMEELRKDGLVGAEIKDVLKSGVIGQGKKNLCNFLVNTGLMSRI
ncbi:Gag-Pol polyprotein [Labeo rohita]|uniref:Gag-Pol polyprotein n=1 Tax=Labeo rohita TaxID=84645 RepID=A0ABQ8LA87_LABRO|nr:Gag-Pol polyprotein [Labeo rohita]